jgi:hypothetical protein
MGNQVSCLNAMANDDHVGAGGADAALGGIEIKRRHRREAPRTQLGCVVDAREPLRKCAVTVGTLLLLRLAQRQRDEACLPRVVADGLPEIDRQHGAILCFYLVPAFSLTQAKVAGARKERGEAAAPMRMQRMHYDRRHAHGGCAASQDVLHICYSPDRSPEVTPASATFGVMRHSCRARGFSKHPTFPPISWCASSAWIALQEVLVLNHITLFD